MITPAPGSPSRETVAPSPSPVVRAGLWALPAYAVLLVVGTWSAQPDQVVDPGGWAEYVASTSYLVTHVLANVLGPVLAVLGTVALGAVLAQSSPRLAFTGLVLATAGQVLLMVPGVISTFATPAIAEAYLRGARDALEVEFAEVTTLITLLAVLLTVAGDVLLGAAVARSRSLPRWSGVVWAVGTVVFYLLGAVLGMATTGSSLPTQPVGAALLALSGAVVAWAARSVRAPDQTSAPGSPATSAAGQT